MDQTRNTEPDPARRRRLLSAVLAFLWLVVIVGLYYVGHKPFDLSLARSLARAGLQLGASLALMSLAGGLGRRLSAGLVQELPPLARMASEAALGLGVLSVGWLLLGATLGTSPLLAWGLLIVLGLAVGRPALCWWGALRNLARLQRQAGRAGLAMALLAGVILFGTLIVALAPPLRFDSLVYHLAIPRAYLEHGRITYLPDNMFWGMPQLVEVLFTWVMALAGDPAGPALEWLAGSLALAGLLGYVSWLCNPRAGWVAVAAMLSGFTLASSLAWGYGSWVAFLYGWATLLWLHRWRERGGRARLLLAGVFSGFALGTKYTAGVLLLAGLGVVGWQTRRSARHSLSAMVMYSSAATLAFSPWMVKNILATGNPFYPLLFPSGAMDGVRLFFYQQHPPWGTWLDAVLLPLRATLYSVEGMTGYGASIGPLLLGLGALAWVGWQKRTAGSQVAISTAGLVAVLGLLIWALASRFSGLLSQTRLYLSIFPALALLAAAGFDNLAALESARLRLSWVVSWVVVFVLGLTALQVGVQTVRMGALRVLANDLAPGDYVANNLGWYSPAAQALRELPPGSSALMLWEPRSLYCAPQCEPDEVLDRWIHAYRTLQDPQAITRNWQEQGYSHLLYYRLGAEFIRQDDRRYEPGAWLALDAFLAGLSQVEDFGETYTLYRLTP